MYQIMPLWVLLTSLITAVVVLLAGESRRRTRITVNLGAAVIKLVLVVVMIRGVLLGHVFMLRVPILPGLDLVLQADALTMLFTTLSAVLWLVTTIYALTYLRNSLNQARFFGFFSLCVAATMGIATAGNLFTFFIFYELLTLATWPLVVHTSTPQALAAGRVYLRYTLAGGALLLLGVVALAVMDGVSDFTAGGTLAQAGMHHDAWLLTLIFVCLILGLGVKAALVPLHGWLPMAMVAPAPVSALLHAVAVVKAGAFGIVRVVYDVYGMGLMDSLHLSTGLAVAAAITIVYGSLRAVWQTDIKRRLAYSTVSQVSYIILGVAVGGPLASVGGLVHLMHQGLMKITLFFCAGAFAQTHGVSRIDQLDGMGRRMPWTTAMFTLGAFGMMGVPPMAGFISKWYLGMGALEAGQPWVIPVLLASMVLNAWYFLPMLQRAWFRPLPQGNNGGANGGANGHPGRGGVGEALPGMLLPAVFTGLLSLAAGLLAGLPLSPLSWAALIFGEEHGP